MLAYQIIAGVTKPFADNVSFDLRYHYLARPDFSVRWDYKGTDCSNSTHN